MSSLRRLSKLPIEKEGDLRKQFKEQHMDRIPGRNMADGGKVSFWRGLREAFGPGEHPFQRGPSHPTTRAPVTTGALPQGRIREAGQAMRESELRRQEMMDDYANGGKVRKNSNGFNGGRVEGPGGPTDDRVSNVNLSDDEYVVPGDTAEAIGYDVLDEIVDATHTPVAGGNSKKSDMADGGSVRDRLRNMGTSLNERVQQARAGASQFARQAGPRAAEAYRYAQVAADPYMERAGQFANRAQEAVRSRAPAIQQGVMNQVDRARAGVNQFAQQAGPRATEAYRYAQVAADPYMERAGQFANNVQERGRSGLRNLNERVQQARAPRDPNLLDDRDVRRRAAENRARTSGSPRPGAAGPRMNDADVLRRAAENRARAPTSAGTPAPPSTPTPAPAAQGPGALARTMRGAMTGLRYMAMGPGMVPAAYLWGTEAGAGADQVPEGAQPFEGFSLPPGTEGQPPSDFSPEGTGGQPPVPPSTGSQPPSAGAPLEIGVGDSAGRETNVPGIYRREGEDNVPEFFNLGPDGQVPNRLRGGTMSVVDPGFFTNPDPRGSQLRSGGGQQSSGNESFEQRMRRLDAEMGSRRIMSRGGMPNRLRQALEMENMRQQGQMAQGDQRFDQALTLEQMRQQGEMGLAAFRAQLEAMKPADQRQLVQDTFDFVDQFYPDPDEAAEIKRVLGGGIYLNDMPPQERAAFAGKMNEVLKRYNETRGGTGLFGLGGRANQASSLRGDPDSPGYQPVDWNPLAWATEERLPGLGFWENYNLRANPLHGIFSGNPRGIYNVIAPDGSRQALPAGSGDADEQMILDRMTQQGGALRR